MLHRARDTARGLGGEAIVTPGTSAIGLLEYHQVDRAREAGRMATREVLPQITELHTAE
nr:hypothetical protein [Mycobacterium simiae]